jgi:single-stranded-DNA-specific exonuclease
LTLSEIVEKLSNRFPDGFQTLADIPAPTLLKDMDIATKRVVKAIRDNERVTIIGDYDVDGVVSSAITYLFFQEVGFDIEIVIPNRFKDGYGITPELLKRVEADLVITVDNGIHAFKSAEILKKRGTDLIITDHHSSSDSLPDAFAIINPKREDDEYPFKNICGAMVTWLFLANIKREMKLEISMSQYLDLVAIATVADVMPILGVNHSIVKAGLQILQISKRASSEVLRDRVGSKISSEDIAFQIAPRLNSSGRMSDAILSFQFLISEDYFEASQLFEELENLNLERKLIEKEIVDEVKSSVDTSLPILLFYSENLHEGVIGIVASRIVDIFKKPAFIFSQTGNILKGSGRSLGNIDIFYLLSEVQDILLKWGGHKMAGGLSLELEKFPEFQNRVIEAMNIYSEKDFSQELAVFGELKLSEISKELLFKIDEFQPFGHENRKPIFKFQNVEIRQIRNIGKEKEYKKVLVQQHNSELEVLFFKKIRQILVGEKISFLASLHISTFKNVETINCHFESWS